MLALLTEEQEALRSMVDELGADIGVTAPSEIGSIDRPSAWDRLAKTGLLELRTREAGSPAASGVEVMVASEALGAALAPVPYLFNGVLAVDLLATVGGQDDLIARVAAGQQQVAIALARDLSGLADPAALDQAVVIGADEATSALVADASGGLYSISLESGLTRLDCADLLLSMHKLAAPGDVEATQVGTLSSADRSRWLALALSAVTADAAGAMGAGLRAAVEYSKVREAFGAPIGTFQALQHLAADSFVTFEATRSLNNYASWGVDELDPDEAVLAARTAKAFMSDRSVAVVEAVMQMFGGIGQTWEHIAHLYARRVLVDTMLFGDADQQFDEIMAARLSHAGDRS